MALRDAISRSHGIRDEITKQAVRSLENSVRDITSTVNTLSASPYGLIRRVVLTGSGVYNASTGCKRAVLRAVGGGGGGGGAQGNGAGGAVAAGAGGGSGTWLEVLTDPGAQVVGGAYSCGAGGAGGAGAASGGNGGDTTITVAGKTYSASGGAGGAGMAQGSTNANAAPGDPSGTTTSGVISSFECGGTGIRLGTAAWWSGRGGSSPFGGGGNSRGGANNGAAATGNGAGGGGAAATLNDSTGGAGSPGLIVIDEYA